MSNKDSTEREFMWTSFFADQMYVFSYLQYKLCNHQGFGSLGPVGCVCVCVQVGQAIILGVLMR